MATETRQVPTGTITDAEQLLRELNVASPSIGTTCTTVAIYPGTPNDTVQMDFVSTPDGNEIDTVIAAHPSYTPGLSASINMSAGTWITIWTLPMSPGETLELSGTIKLTIGTSADMQVGKARFSSMGRRRSGGNAYIPGTTVSFDGDIPQSRLRFVTSGAFVSLQVLTQAAGVATVSGNVFTASEILP